MQPRPLTPDRKRHVMRCVGVIDPRQVYTTEGLLRFAGIGREMLVVARASGIVRPIEIGHRLYYLGAEVIRWIESQRKGKPHDRNDSGNCEGRAEEFDVRD